MIIPLLALTQPSRAQPLSFIVSKPYPLFSIYSPLLPAKPDLASGSEWLQANYSDNYSEVYGRRTERLRAAVAAATSLRNVRPNARASFCRPRPLTPLYRRALPLPPLFLLLFFLLPLLPTTSYHYFLAASMSGNTNRRTKVLPENSKVRTVRRILPRCVPPGGEKRR